MSDLSINTETPSQDVALTSLLDQDAIPMATLHEQYGPILKLVNVLLGVIPNCDPYMEIWPTSFRTYNVMVPNFLNLPFSLFGVGGAPKEIVGLAMYVASRAAECNYCSAHSCTFALRRGTAPEKVAQALVGGDSFTDQELAAIAVARSLGRIPCELTDEERQNLKKNFSPAEEESVVLVMVMMGFLNKFMDAMGIPLEDTLVAEVMTTIGSGWSPGTAGRFLDPTAKTTAPPSADTLWTKLSVIPLIPTALRLDKQWQKGVPNRWPEIGQFLRDNTGHDFPVLSRMNNGRAIQAIGTILRDNFSATNTVIGLEAKVLMGLIFATIIDDQPLAQEVRLLGQHLGMSSDQFTAAVNFAQDAEAPSPATDPKMNAAMIMARAASPSPAEITTDVVEVSRQSDLESAAIVELITWISILQLLHRLSSYFVD